MSDAELVGDGGLDLTGWIEETAGHVSCLPMTSVQLKCCILKQPRCEDQGRLVLTFVTWSSGLNHHSVLFCFYTLVFESLHMYMQKYVGLWWFSVDSRALEA